MPFKIPAKPPQTARDRRHLPGHTATAVREYRARLDDLAQLRALGAQPPPELLALVEVADAIAQLASEAAEQAAAAPAPPNPGDLVAAVKDGEEPAKALAAAERALRKAALPAELDRHLDAALIVAQTAASRAISQARGGKLIALLQPLHAEAFTELADLVHRYPVIVAMDSEKAVRAEADTRDAWLRSRDLLKLIGRLEDHAQALRDGDSGGPEHLRWNLDAADEKTVKRLHHNPILGQPGPAKPSFLHITAAGGIRRLPTRQQLKEVREEARNPSVIRDSNGDTYLTKAGEQRTRRQRLHPNQLITT